MVVKTLIKKGFYQDSVALMRISRQISNLPGVVKASVMMGTLPNKDVLKEAGLCDEQVNAADPGDMIVAVSAENEEIAGKALALAEETVAGTQVEEKGEQLNARGDKKIRSIVAGLGELKDANLAVISVPGTYAAAEALKALKNGLHVFLFSDNVSIEDEVDIKTFAHRRGLLVMGPDCGTAVLNGVPLGFANSVRRGGIGLVGASGTGLQEVMCLIDRWGSGLSQAFGTGSRDLSESVGGITMLDAFDILAGDDCTSVIVLISKPPAQEVAQRIIRRSSNCCKPVVVCFLGSEEQIAAPGVHVVNTLEDAARTAVSLDQGKAPEAGVVEKPEAISRATGKYLRGFFAGGTLAEEAFLVARTYLGTVYSNLPGGEKLEDSSLSKAHTIIDMGSDEFTVGRPHPMLDFSIRKERFLAEAADSEVGVILMDIVLGYGAHPDPAAELAPVISRAIKQAQGSGRALHVVLTLVGTEADPQQYSIQAAGFKQSGALVAPTNLKAARLAVILTGMMADQNCERGGY